jgi:hypothetical protein
MTGAFAFVRHRFTTRATEAGRSLLAVDTPAYRLARRAYWALRSNHRLWATGRPRGTVRMD